MREQTAQQRCINSKIKKTNVFQQQASTLWGSSPVLDYLLHLALTLAFVITSSLSLEEKHALAKYRSLISQRAPASTACTDIMRANICPDVEESLESFHNASVCPPKI